MMADPRDWPSSSPPPPPPSPSLPPPPSSSEGEGAETRPRSWWRRKRVLIPSALLVVLVALSDQDGVTESDESPVEVAGSLLSETATTATTAASTTAVSTTANTEPSAPSTTNASSASSSAPETTARLTQASTTAFSFECRLVFADAAAISAMQDTWPDIFLAFDNCPSVDAMVAAATEFDPDGRWDALVGNADLVLTNLCDEEGWPDGPHETAICVDFVE